MTPPLGRNVVNASTARRIRLLAAFIAAGALPAAAQSQPQPLAQGPAPLVELDSPSSRGLDSPSSRSDVPTADWTRWTSGRYRITPGDILNLTFPFVPELNQAVTVQPDGYITLKEIDDLRVQGRTVAQV